MEEYIIKNIMKNNPSMSHEDAEKDKEQDTKQWSCKNYDMLMSG